MWQRKHAKLYPNRLEFYNKTRDGHVIKGKEGKGVEVNSLLIVLLICYF